MLEKPNLSDDGLVACLRDAYDLRVAQLDFLPLGADVNSAVYRAVSTDGSAFFVKLRCGPFDELSAAIPGFLGEQGIASIIAPRRAAGGALWCRLEPYTVTVYPFVSARDAYEVELSEQQWVEFGAALKSIHAAPLPTALRDRLPRETYTPHWGDRVREYQKRARRDTFDEPVAAELARFMRGQETTITRLVEAADRLAAALAARRRELILCHADIHAGNLLITDAGALYIVDWDTAMLAPKERDLMYPGSGLGRGWGRAETLVWFYQGYGPATVDAAAIAYYRCDRVVRDIAEFCEQLLDTTEGGQDRAQALRFLTGSFDTNGIVDIALQSYHVIADG